MSTVVTGAIDIVNKTPTSSEPSRGTSALAFLLTEASRVAAPAETLSEMMHSLSLPVSLVDASVAAYESNREVIRTKLSKMTPSLPSLSGFSWRLDTRVAQRSVHQIAEPEYLLNFKLTQGQTNTEEFVKADVRTLRHLQTELEAALRVARTQHARRVFRYVQ